MAEVTLVRSRSTLLIRKIRQWSKEVNTISNELERQKVIVNIRRIVGELLTKMKKAENEVKTTTYRQVLPNIIDRKSIGLLYDLRVCRMQIRRALTISFGRYGS